MLPVNGSVPVSGTMPMRGEVPVVGSMPVHGSIPVNANIPISGHIPIGGQAAIGAAACPPPAFSSSIGTTERLATSEKKGLERQALGSTGQGALLQGGQSGQFAGSGRQTWTA